MIPRIPAEAERAGTAPPHRPPESRRRRWALWLGLMGLALFGPGLYEWVRLSLAQWRLDRRVAELEERHEALTQERQRLESDPSYVEGLIRSTFKVAAKGEIVIPLEDEKAR
ncbi:MAG: septum formation initiator family protein, partial [Candidatus Omnitrophica bacterium]|nr:septum formation initiator family protein [Candidatus Omnitrophota bacterium]